MHREIRIYMPNLTKTEDVERFKDNKPFLMRAHIPTGSRFLQVVSIPSMVDLMGFSGGGGPPGYAWAVTNALGADKHIFITALPNQSMPDMSELGSMAVEFEPLGVAQCVGVLFGHFKVVGPAVDDGRFETRMTDAGGFVVDMIQYEPPPVLRTLYHPKLEKTLGGEEKPPEPK